MKPSAQPRNCVRCSVPITDANDSREHVISNSIGGRLRTSGFICITCNNEAGNSWDAELARQLNSLSIFFDIIRDRGVPPAESIETTAGEHLMMLPGGGFTLPKPEYSVVPRDGGAQVKIVARNMREARKMLEGLARKHPSVDVTALLASASPTQTYPQGMVHLPLELRGELAGRSIVKTAVAIAHHAGVPVETADIALTYLRDGATSACFGFYYEQDLLLNRPAGIPLHCAAVSGDPTTGLLLGYVEYFGWRRMVVCLSKSYIGPVIDYAHALNPRTGEVLSLSARMPFVSSDIEEIYDYKRIPDGSMEGAFRAVAETAMRRQFERERERVISDAVEYAFANCGAKIGDCLTQEQLAKLGSLLAERMTPYIMRHIPQLPVPPYPRRQIT